MFGPVSLSNSYPRVAKDMLVWFYSHYFNDNEDLGHSFAPYVLDQDALETMDRIFCGDHYKADFRVLKEQLEFLGVSVPTLYKQYSELCEEGGVRFLDFGVDADFNYCIDGLVLVDIEFVKAKKRKRYMGDDGGRKRLNPSYTKKAPMQTHGGFLFTQVSVSAYLDGALISASLSTKIP